MLLVKKKLLLVKKISFKLVKKEVAISEKQMLLLVKKKESKTKKSIPAINKHDFYLAGLLV